MKKLSYLIATILMGILLMACGGSTKNNGESAEASVDPSAAQSKSGVKAAVTRMYAKYFNSDITAERDTTLDIFGLVGDYLDADFEDLMRKAIRLQEETDELIFDYDPFINAQECLDLQLCDVEVTDYTPEQAKALVTFMNLDEQDTAIVVMNYDKVRDAWLLSDFINPAFGNSYVDNIKECFRVLGKPLE